MSDGTQASPSAPPGWLATRRGRRLLFGLLYFAEGAPIGFVWWALPVWLHGSGAAPGEIARIMAWVAWPWALKFLWAPLVDLARGPRFGLRGWILGSQVGMALALAPLLFVDLGADTDAVLAILVVHALLAATQDASIDSLAVHSVPPGERGAINGWMQVGMLGARGLFGGGAVLLAARTGEQVVLALLMASLLATALLVAGRLRSGGAGAIGSERGRLSDYREALLPMLGRRELWLGLLFASLVGAGFESLASLGGPLLLDRGAREETVGFFFLLPSVALMATGALLGGRAADRWGRRRATLVGEALAAIAVLGVAAAAHWLPADAGPVPFVSLLGALYLAAGGATAALYSLLMDLVDPRLAATQFCVFMAGINLCYVWSTRVLGLLVDGLGYGPAIAVMGLVSLLALPLLRCLGRGPFHPHDRPGEPRPDAPQEDTARPL